MLIPKLLLLMLIPKPFLLVLHLMFNLSLKLFLLMCILSHRLLLSLMHHLRFLEGLLRFHTNLLIYSLIIAIKSPVHLHVLFHQFLRKVLLILSIISCLTLTFPHIINTFANSISSDVEPTSYAQVVKNPKWRDVMAVEVVALEVNNT